jgi:hypothetical protein
VQFWGHALKGQLPEEIRKKGSVVGYVFGSGATIV